MRKLISTLRIAATLIAARTFGRYIHSGWNGVHEYSRYKWRGKVWTIPLTPNDEDGFY